MTLDSLIAKHVFNLPPEHSEIPSWSTDLMSAWQIVEEMERKGFWLRLLTDWYPERNRVFVWFIPHNKHHNPFAEIYASTAPLAICLAALAALEVTHGSL